MRASNNKNNTFVQNIKRQDLRIIKMYEKSLVAVEDSSKRAQMTAIRKICGIKLLNILSDNTKSGITLNIWHIQIDSQPFYTKS